MSSYNGTRSIRNGGTEDNVSSAVLFPNGPVREWHYAVRVCDQHMTEKLQLTTAGELPDSELRYKAGSPNISFARSSARTSASTSLSLLYT